MKCCVSTCRTKSPIKRCLPVLHEKVFKKGIRICDDDFSVFCRIPGSKKLNLTTLPTLFLSNFHETPTEENRFMHLIIIKRILVSNNSQIYIRYYQVQIYNLILMQQLLLIVQRLLNQAFLRILICVHLDQNLFKRSILLPVNKFV